MEAAVGRPFKIALIVDQLTVTHQVHDLVTWAQAQPDIELCGLVIQQPATRAATGGASGSLQSLAKSKGWYAALSYAAFVLVGKIERKYVERYPWVRERLALHKIDHPAKVRVVPVVSASGFVYRYTPEDLAAVRAGAGPWS